MLQPLKTTHWQTLTHSLVHSHTLTHSLVHSLTHSMEQSPSWEANRFSASQEIPRILRNPKVHYRTHKCPPPIPILSQLDPFSAPHPTSWRSILILSSHLRLGLPSGLCPSVFLTKTLYTPLLYPIHATCPGHTHKTEFMADGCPSILLRLLSNNNGCLQTGSLDKTN